MARINLLPWREARRETLKREFFSNLASMAIGACMLLGVIYFFINNTFDNQTSRNQYLQESINKLNKEVAEIAELKSSRAQLVDRMEIIQGLQGYRPVIVRVFDQFVETLPDGVYYTRLKRSAQSIEIDGTAESNNRVSSLMRRLDKSEWFFEPNLTTVVANPNFGEQANNFSLLVSLGKVEGEEE